MRLVHNRCKNPKYGAKAPTRKGPCDMFFFSSRRRHTILQGDWSSDVCSSDLAVASNVGWLGSHAWVISAVTLAGAGVYQFSSLKYRCLEKCRSPLSFITEHWHGRGERGQAFILGVHHGLFCVGCCWLLMLLMFAVGVGSLGWMLALGAVMALEKNMPWGRRVSAPLGVALLA